MFTSWGISLQPNWLSGPLRVFFSLHTHKKHCESVTLSTRPGGHWKRQTWYVWCWGCSGWNYSQWSYEASRAESHTKCCCTRAKFEKRNKHFCKHELQCKRFDAGIHQERKHRVKVSSSCSQPWSSHWYCQGFLSTEQTSAALLFISN